MPATGLKKGVVVNIDQTVRSIADAVERAERLSGFKIDRAFVGVGGQHVGVAELAPARWRSRRTPAR